jgi:hypothetical protein
MSKTVNVTYVIMRTGQGSGTESSRKVKGGFASLEEAEKQIEKMIPDLMGTVEFYIRKVYSNKIDL